MNIMVVACICESDQHVLDITEFRDTLCIVVDR